MPPELQVKLLRVLETGTLNRVGGTDMIHVDIRVIAATNRRPDEAIAAGKLREDLLYRLNVLPVELPPLRERRDDIELLAEHFIDELNKESGTAKRFTAAALQRLRAPPARATSAAQERDPPAHPRGGRHRRRRASARRDRGCTRSAA
jgi:transcriptional regulator with PAS, ATPase and Fis domain